MDKVAIVYFFGSGSTRMIAECYQELLPDYVRADKIKMSPDMDYSELVRYKYLILGFPVYHFSLPKSVKAFLDNMPDFDHQIYATTFATYALILGNSMRSFIKGLKAKNITVRSYATFRGPASDMALFGDYKYFKKYHGSNRKKIRKSIEKLLTIDAKEKKTPAFKLYAPVTSLINRFTEPSYRQFPHKFHVLADKCSQCYQCVLSCHWDCWDKNDKVPVMAHPEKCEICLRCIHNCPQKAICVNEKDVELERLDKEFYRKRKIELLYG